MSMLSRQATDPLIAAGPNLNTVRSLGSFAVSETFTNADLRDVWEVGGIRPWPTHASTFSIVSDSDEDKPTGRGAWNAEWRGLLDDGTEATELITLDGLTPVTTQEEYLRGNFWKVHQCGTVADTENGANLGVLTATHTGDATVQGIINGPPRSGIMRNSHFTTPVTHNGFVRNIFINVQSSQAIDLAVDIFILARPMLVPNAARVILAQINGVKGTHDINRSDNPMFIPPFTDVWTAARRATNQTVTVQMDMLVNLVSL